MSTLVSQAVAVIRDEQLRAAYIACRERAVQRGYVRWPDTFDEAMADPTLSRIVRVTARYGLMQPLEGEPPTRAARPAAPAPARAQFRPLAPGAIDIKRVAAGDVDD